MHSPVDHDESAPVRRRRAVPPAEPPAAALPAVQPRARATRDAMLRVGRALLQERDFDELSIADLAAANGLSVGSFYGRFRDKASFLALLQQQVTEEWLERGRAFLADAKRGDIGSTMDGYARAWLAIDGPFLADAVTISPYLGSETLDETVSFASKNSKGIFILAATSNPEAKDLQSSVAANNQTVASSVASYAARFNEKPLGSVGLVIGAQANLVDMAIETAALGSTPILAPGFGSQGAELPSARSIFGELSDVTIFNVARSVAGDSPIGLLERVQSARAELGIGLSR